MWSGRGHCVWLITRPGMSYRVCVCVIKCVMCNNKHLHTTNKQTNKQKTKEEKTKEGSEFCPQRMLVCSVLQTYLLTPWSRVLLEKLTGSAASQEITRIFGTRRFITAFTSPRHLSLLQPARSSPYPHNPLREDPS